MLLPKAIAYYRSVRNSTAIQGKPVQPLPPPVSRALAILFAVAVVALISTLPYFAPYNIFTLTQSRLKIPTDVLFTRLGNMRPHGLNEMDTQLRQKLLSLESRLLYFQFGPDAIANCLFCNAEDPKSYLYYSIPSIAKTHLFNLCIIALVTSGLFVGPEGARWRTQATIGAIALAGLELWMVSTYDYQANSRATRLEDVETFHWKMRVYRNIGIATLDALLGWVMYLSATNRAFVTPHTAPERVENTIRILDSARSKMSAAGVIKNTIIRDEGLRNRNQSYWVHEGRLMNEMMENREVLQGVNNALENRINMDRISADAEMYAGKVIGVPDMAGPS